MTISDKIIAEVAPDVASAAQKNGGLVNPFISFTGLEILCKGDQTLESCLEELIMYSLRYAETVCQFQQIVSRGQESNENELRKDIEKVRSTLHDATIASIDILSRNMKKAGRNNDWIARLKSGGRPVYGKFAILLAFEVVLQGERDNEE